MTTRTKPPLCAFCVSLPLPATRGLSLSSAACPLPPRPPQAPLRRAPSAPPARRSPSHPKRRRRAGPPPVAMALPNDSNDKLRAQVAESIMSAGRFLQSPTGQLVLWAGLIWLVLTGRIGFLFDSFLILFAVACIVPVLAIVGFRWWINRQLVQGACPTCGAPVTGLRNQAFQCMNCGNTVQGEKGDFSVKDPSSATIDIDAKEVDDF